MSKVTLYQFSRFWGLPNVSPFCMKLETYLRMADIDYEYRPANNPQKSPKGKLPIIKIDGTTIGDSSLIIRELKLRFGDPLDQTLTHEQKGLALAFQHLCEEHLYWILMYNRWVDEHGWTILKPLFFGNLSTLKGMLMAKATRRYMTKALYYQGMGRHRAEEVYHFGIQNIRAIASQLQGKTYFFSHEAPSSIDACLCATLSNIWYAPIASPIKEEMGKYPDLITYCDRILNRYFPELSKRD